MTQINKITKSLIILYWGRVSIFTFAFCPHNLSFPKFPVLFDSPLTSASQSNHLQTARHITSNGNRFVTNLSAIYICILLCCIQIPLQTHRISFESEHLNALRYVMFFPVSDVHPQNFCTLQSTRKREFCIQIVMPKSCFPQTNERQKSNSVQ